MFRLISMFRQLICDPVTGVHVTPSSGSAVGVGFLQKWQQENISYKRKWINHNIAPIYTPQLQVFYFTKLIQLTCNMYVRWQAATPKLLNIYRVSIKSFPDYKHLLQENYVEYKLFFLNVTQLKKCFLQHISTLQHVLLLLKLQFSCNKCL